MSLDIHNFTQNEVDKKFFEQALMKGLVVVGVKDKVEISLAIVGDGRMRRLNKMYRGKNRVTDVLSFDNKSVLPYLNKAFPKLKKNQDEFILPDDGIKRLGEIIICYPQAKKQAKKLNHSLEQEIRTLFIHGLLHLLGYDHEKDEQAEKDMKTMEEKIINSIK